MGWSQSFDHVVCHEALRLLLQYGILPDVARYRILAADNASPEEAEDLKLSVRHGGPYAGGWGAFTRPRRTGAAVVAMQPIAPVADR